MRSPSTVAVPVASSMRSDFTRREVVPGFMVCQSVFAGLPGNSYLGPGVSAGTHLGMLVRASYLPFWESR